MYEYVSTHGTINYDGQAHIIESVDDPIPPAGPGWELVSAAPTGHVKWSSMGIVWTWRREVTK